MDLSTVISLECSISFRYDSNCISHSLGDTVIVFFSRFINMSWSVEFGINRSIFVLKLIITFSDLTTQRLSELFIWVLSSIHANRKGFQLDLWFVTAVYISSLSTRWTYRFLRIRFDCYDPASYWFSELISRWWVLCLACFFFFLFQFLQLLTSELLLFSFLLSLLLCLFFFFLLLHNVLTVVRAS